METAPANQDLVLQDLALQDKALIEGLRAGREDAYELLILRYEQPVFGIVSRVMDDPEDAADVTQEVFLKVFRKIDAFRGDSSLKTWIYRIAVNEAHNHRRWFGRHRGQEVALEPAAGQRGVEDLVPDRGPSPYESARDRETHALIERALKQVSAHYRTVLVLREIEGLGYEEIAGILEISLGTVKSRILRGREALRKLLIEQFEPAPASAVSMGAGARPVARASSPGVNRPGVNRPMIAARSAVRASTLEGSDAV
jgi:RNA polymerase sigma-70 factor (ECF subfamily)